MAELRTTNILGVGDDKPSYENEYQGRKNTVYVKAVCVVGKEGPEDTEVHSQSKKLINALKGGADIHFKPRKVGELWILNATAKDNPELVPPSDQGGKGWRPMSTEEALQIERAKYPSFAVSYAKDAIVALVAEGAVKPDDVGTKVGVWAKAFFRTMNELSEEL